MNPESVGEKERDSEDKRERGRATHRGDLRADDDTATEALDAAERDINKMTPGDIGALVALKIAESRKRAGEAREALLKRNGLDLESMVRGGMGAGK